jgi:putative membrane protein
MTDVLGNYYLWLKTLHIIAVISWMAGMLYLPRLFVYHADAAKNSELSETFKIMERRLLRFIMNPAMIAVWILGLLMIAANMDLMRDGWMHAKMTLVFAMSGVHGFFAVCVKKFARDENKHSAKFYRIINEAPTILMILIVILVVLKPF